MNYDSMLRRGGGRPYGPPPRNQFGGGRGGPGGPRPRYDYNYDYGWGAVEGSRRMQYGNWDEPRGFVRGGGYGRGEYGGAYEGPSAYRAGQDFGGGWRGGYGQGGGYGRGGGQERGGRGPVPGEFGDAPFGGPPPPMHAGGYTYGGGNQPAPRRGRESQARGYDRGWGQRGDLVREPFMPEEAYRRHPEYRQPVSRAQREHQWEYEDEDLSDDEILQSVRARMHQDVWLDVDRINIEVEDGVVTLTGEVDDFLEARYAWDDAWETPGVRGVVNHLTVRTDEPNDSHGDMLAQSSGEPSPAKAEAEGTAEGGEIGNG